MGGPNERLIYIPRFKKGLLKTHRKMPITNTSENSCNKSDIVITHKSMICDTEIFATIYWKIDCQSMTKAVINLPETIFDLNNSWSSVSLNITKSRPSENDPIRDLYINLDSANTHSFNVKLFLIDECNSEYFIGEFSGKHLMHNNKFENIHVPLDKKSFNGCKLKYIRDKKLIIKCLVYLK